MERSAQQLLRQHAQAIWQAGVDAVDSQSLLQRAVTCTSAELTICGHAIPLADLGRLCVVGAGKAGAGMASGLELALGEAFPKDRLSGFVNVPADCVRELSAIQLHAARPAGVNEPCPEGVFGAETILSMVGELSARDVCVVLLSGGGSALLPAPLAGLSLSDKQSVTRLLMHAGATIQELNCVRKQLSRIKGGRLAMATHAGLVIALIISDVIGDPLDVIASGPTVPDPQAPHDALEVLRKYDPDRTTTPLAVWECLKQHADSGDAESFPSGRVFNHILGSNAVAMAAAARQAEELGYRVQSLGSENADEAREIGKQLAIRGRELLQDQNADWPACVLSGGEPVVHLVQTDQPQKGGRNQELALAALIELGSDVGENIVLLSGGTDGEDGPTDAAGAFADGLVRESAIHQNLDPHPFLAVNNSYPFFEQTGGLFKTGPTHTNVMDLRVLLVGKGQS